MKSLLSFLIFLAVSSLGSSAKPNFVIIFCDDLGYGDLGCYGHPTIRTPNLDRMAREGMRFTQFYSAASVCTPSRAALMTGRLPVRNGMCSDKRRVLFPNSKGGLPSAEITIAESLKEEGYKTGIFGKWHLGHLPKFLPTKHGFDEYVGIPYSNDMDKVSGSPRGATRSHDPAEIKKEFWNVPLIRGAKEIERPVDQNTITRRYTQEAASFIKKNKDDPFLVYLPHSMPHVPLFRSPKFAGTSSRGLYGDVIEEIDWSVGYILQILRDEGLSENTMVFFTSDNGPWLTQGLAGGTAGLLREGKGSTWEGGMREPAIAWWPSKIKSGKITQALGTTMDLFVTCVNLAGAKVSDDRIYDGVDLSPVLFGLNSKGRDVVYYYRGTRLYAIRKGPWKAHFITQPAYGRIPAVKHELPQLYHLDIDPSEKNNVAKQNPKVIEELKGLAKKHQKKVRSVPSQLEL